MGVNYKRSYCLGFHVKCGLWPWSWVTRHLRVFFYKEMYGCFAGPKKSGRNNEVSVLPRWSAHQTNQSGWFEAKLTWVTFYVVLYCKGLCLVFFPRSWIQEPPLGP